MLQWVIRPCSHGRQFMSSNFKNAISVVNATPSKQQPIAMDVHTTPIHVLASPQGVCACDIAAGDWLLEVKIRRSSRP